MTARWNAAGSTGGATKQDLPCGPTLSVWRSPNAPPLKATTALVLVALLAAPAFAATVDPAKEVNAVKTDVLMPVGSLTPMIGEWSAGDLNFLDKAASIKVFDTKALYSPADLQKIASAETSQTKQLGSFRDAIRADAGSPAGSTRTTSTSTASWR